MKFSLSSGVKDENLSGWSFEVLLCVKNNGSIEAKCSDKIGKCLKEASENKIFDAKPETTLTLIGHGDKAKNTLAIGLGPESELTQLESFRRAGAVAYRELYRLKAENVTANFSYFDKSGWSKNIHKFVSAFYEGFYLAGYEFTKFKKNEEGEQYNLNKFSVSLDTKYTNQLKSSLDISNGLCEGVTTARALGDNPGNIINPETLSAFVEDHFKNTKVEVEVWDKARLKKEKMELLLGVGQGSAIAPRLIIMRYKNANTDPVCFVGKGITFDSGGISLKPPLNMEEMKFDMCGAADVIGTLSALNAMKAKVNVVGIVATAENMPGPSATKPGDIHRARNGLYVEVQNTDAEGRLALGDALAFASETKPKFIVDVATLTGAMVIALGKFHVGYYARDEKLAKSINNALEYSGEEAWRLPLCESHRKLMKGDYSDLKNIAATRECGSAQGAAFLSYFVDIDIPWAHFDIAGTAWNVGDEYPYCNKKGASGIMVRTFCQLAINECS